MGDWMLIFGDVGIGFCVICSCYTAWRIAKQIFARGRPTGYNLWQCDGCHKAGSARPQKGK